MSRLFLFALSVLVFLLPALAVAGEPLCEPGYRPTFFWLETEFSYLDVRFPADYQVVVANPAGRTVARLNETTVVCHRRWGKNGLNAIWGTKVGTPGMMQPGRRANFIMYQIRGYHMWDAGKVILVTCYQHARRGSNYCERMFKGRPQ